MIGVMSVMPGPFPANLPPLTPELKAELETKARKKRNVAVTAELSGLTILAFGLGLWLIPVGIATFGLGIVLIGIGIELG